MWPYQPSNLIHVCGIIFFSKTFTPILSWLIGYHQKIDRYNLFYSFILQSCNDWCERLAREQIDLLTTESIGFMNKYHVCIIQLNRDRGIYSCGRSKQSDCLFWPWFSRGEKNKHDKYAVHINGDFCLSFY